MCWEDKFVLGWMFLNENADTESFKVPNSKKLVWYLCRKNMPTLQFIEKLKTIENDLRERQINMAAFITNNIKL